MAKLSVAELKKQCDHVFDKKYPVLQLWQTLADHFYPERADFTTTRNIGAELSDQLVNSQPILMRRDLCNSFSSMLRDGEWFSMTINGETSHMGNMWLEWASRRMRQYMYDRTANFVRSTKQGDHDYGTFGQAVLSVEPNKQRNGLLFRNWHLRDCAWWEDETGQIGGVVRKWKPTALDLQRIFGDKIHARTKERLKKEPFYECDVRHMVIPADMYQDETIKTPFVSIFIDMENEHILEEVGINHRYYVVPRFQTIAGSPYAYSPATVAALPDARTLQAMTFTLLEAGERYTRPPMVATQRAIRSDVDLSSDGITWVDDEYDERLGAALRPLTQNLSGFPIGIDQQQSVVEVMSSAFYLNKLTLPETSREMTATEVIERMKQYRRENLPLFAPIESEYNGALCEMTFEVAMQMGLFGSPYDIPDELRNQDVEFKFTSPLSQSEEEEKVTKFAQVSDMLARAAQFDPAAADNIDFDIAIRDATKGMGAPSIWMQTVDDVTATRQNRAQAQAIETQMAIEQGKL